MLRFVFIYLGFLLTATATSVPVTGKHCSFKFVDVDGRTLTSSDGVVTVLVLTNKKDADKARLVGDRIPARCLGGTTSRMVTVVHFQQTQNSALRFFFTSMMRRRLDSEAGQLRSRYAAKGLHRDARKDVYGVADFDRKTDSQLGLPADSSQFRVLIISANGILTREWTDVPSADDLSNALP